MPERERHLPLRNTSGSSAMSARNIRRPSVHSVRASSPDVGRWGTFNLASRMAAAHAAHQPPIRVPADRGRRAPCSRRNTCRDCASKANAHKFMFPWPPSLRTRLAGAVPKPLPPGAQGHKLCRGLSTIASALNWAIVSSALRAGIDEPRFWLGLNTCWCDVLNCGPAMDHRVACGRSFSGTCGASMTNPAFCKARAASSNTWNGRHARSAMSSNVLDPSAWFSTHRYAIARL